MDPNLIMSLIEGIRSEAVLALAHPSGIAVMESLPLIAAGLSRLVKGHSGMREAELLRITSETASLRADPAFRQHPLGEALGKGDAYLQGVELERGAVFAPQEQFHAAAADYVRDRFRPDEGANTFVLQLADGEYASRTRGYIGPARSPAEARIAAMHGINPAEVIVLSSASAKLNAQRNGLLPKPLIPHASIGGLGPDGKLKFANSPILSKLAGQGVDVHEYLAEKTQIQPVEQLASQESRTEVFHRQDGSTVTVEKNRDISAEAVAHKPGDHDDHVLDNQFGTALGLNRRREDITQVSELDEIKVEVDTATGHSFSRTAGTTFVKEDGREEEEKMGQGPRNSRRPEEPPSPTPMTMSM